MTRAVCDALSGVTMDISTTAKYSACVAVNAHSGAETWCSACVAVSGWWRAKLDIGRSELSAAEGGTTSGECR